MAYPRFYFLMAAWPMFVLGSLFLGSSFFLASPGYTVVALQHSHNYKHGENTYLECYYLLDANKVGYISFKMCDPSVCQCVKINSTLYCQKTYSTHLLQHSQQHLLQCSVDHITTPKSLLLVTLGSALCITGIIFLITAALSPEY